jgi:hypothetical protein
MAPIGLGYWTGQWGLFLGIGTRTNFVTIIRWETTHLRQATIHFSKNVLSHWKEIEMKKLVLLVLGLLIFASPTQSWADSDRSTHSGYLQQDILFKSRTNIYDRSGRKKGYVQQDVLSKDTKNIYDRDGRRRGHVKQDSLFSDRKIIYDKDGRRTGYIRQDPIFKDTKVISDKNGKTKGYLRKDPLFKDRTNIQKR